MKAFPEGSENLTIVETHVIRRLKLSNLFSYLLQSLNIEKGWLFSLKHLFANPGSMALDYTASGRLKYVAPFKMLFITTTLAFFALKYSGTAEVFAEGVVEGAKDKTVINLLEKASDYFNILIWIYIPIAAIFTWLINKKRTQLNYAENLVFHTYFFVLTNILTLLIMLDRWVYQSSIWNLLMFGFLLFYNMYAYKSFFSKKWLRAALESTFLFLFNSLLYFAFLIFILAIYVKYQ